MLLRSAAAPSLAGCTPLFHQDITHVAPSPLPSSDNSAKRRLSSWASSSCLPAHDRLGAMRNGQLSLLHDSSESLLHAILNIYHAITRPDCR